MPVPPDPIIRASLLWLNLLRSSGKDRVGTLLRSHPDFARFTPTQYEAAYEWLAANGLIQRAQGLALEQIPALVFEAAIGHALWIADADALISDSNELPADAVRAAITTGIKFPRALAVVREVSFKVNTENRERIGLVGELGFVDILRESLNAVVDHVAIISDGYGYDIVVEGNGVTVNIELKSTTRSARTRIFISRNEFEVGREDRHWVLVVARLDAGENVVGVSTIDRTWLCENVPVDKSGVGRWQSASLDVPGSALLRGVPPLVPLLKAAHHDVLMP